MPYKEDPREATEVKEPSGSAFIPLSPHEDAGHQTMMEVESKKELEFAASLGCLPFRDSRLADQRRFASFIAHCICVIQKGTLYL